MKRSTPAVFTASVLWFVFAPARISHAAAPGTDGLVAEAKREMLAGRYESAIPLYSKLVAEEPGNGAAWYGLVRAQIQARHARDGYASAERALAEAANTSGGQAAAGIAAYRRGEFVQAERFFRAALKIDPNNPAALTGLAGIYSAVSLFRSARDLRLRAYKLAPDDPQLMIAYAETLKGAAHISALRAALARLDPSAEQASRLRVHIANDLALGDRKPNRLVSAYESARVKLFPILDGPRRPRGVGVTVRLNGKQTARLLLDTGASGIAVSPKLAEKAGLEIISGDASEIRGIGDRQAQSAVAYIAQKLQIGEVEFADYSIYAFRSAKTADYDGLIGADALGRFLVKIDFPQLEMTLEPRPGLCCSRTAGAERPLPPNAVSSDDSEGPVDANPKLEEGFSRLYRIGDHLIVPTFINNATKPVLFLVDSGGSVNLIDSDTAREFTHVDNDPRTTVKGIQGAVKQTSRAEKISLQFANFRQDNPDLIAISLEKMSDGMGVAFGGILGLPVLSHLAVTIDYREGAIRFDYNGR